MFLLNQELIDACWKGNFKLVKFLVKQGSDIHVGNDLPLQWASLIGHLEMVKYLVKSGADIHENDDYALICASDKGHLKVLKYLIKDLPKQEKTYWLLKCLK